MGFEASEVDPLAIRVLEEKGYPTEGLYSKMVSRFLGKEHFGYLITLCDRANEKCPVFPCMENASTDRLMILPRQPAARMSG